MGVISDFDSLKPTYISILVNSSINYKDIKYIAGTIEMKVTWHTAKYGNPYS